MDKENMNPKLPTTDEIREDFENYRVRYERQLEINRYLILYFNLEKDMKQLANQVHKLRLGMNKLIRLQLDLDLIQELPSGLDANHPLALLGEEQKERDQLAAKYVAQQQLMISCGSSVCLFENCRRRVDSQFMLLHYLSDHSEDENGAFLRCHKLGKDQRIVLSFDTKCCIFRQNQVIGLLSYHGASEEQQEVVPIVVVICKTSSERYVLTDTQKQTSDSFYVIWLATPNPVAQVQLNAMLRLCGRDAATQANTLLCVRTVITESEEREFMEVDGHYWCLSSDEIRKISNDFRDELHLEVSITELALNHELSLVLYSH